MDNRTIYRLLGVSFKALKDIRYPIFDISRPIKELLICWGLNEGLSEDLAIYVCQQAVESRLALIFRRGEFFRINEEISSVDGYVRRSFLELRNININKRSLL